MLHLEMRAHTVQAGDKPRWTRTVNSDTLVRNQPDLGEAKPDKKEAFLGWWRSKEEYRLQRTTREVKGQCSHRNLS